MMFRWYLTTDLGLQITYHTHGQNNVEIGLACAFSNAIISSYLDVLFQIVMMLEARKEILLLHKY